MAIGFYNDNAARRYPIVDSPPPPRLIRVSDSVSFDLPVEAIVDAGFLFGPVADYDPSITTLYLNKIDRIGDVITFDFACTRLPNVALFFARSISDPDWVTSWAEATLSDGVTAPSGHCGTLFLWQGFLATGTLASIVAMLPDGDSLLAGLQFEIEPTTIQSLRDDYVTSINIGNKNRTVVAIPGEPAPPPTPVYHLQQQCMYGVISVIAGFNVAITQDQDESSLTFDASQGSGAGEPCEEIPTHPFEEPPVGSPFFTGGPPCNEVILAIDGQIGPAISLQGGLGVSITRDPDDIHSIIVALDQKTMVIPPE